jgi:hypothetical protein
MPSAAAAPFLFFEHHLLRLLLLLLRCSYHVDSLLSMYDLYRHLGENEYAEVCVACVCDVCKHRMSLLRQRTASCLPQASLTYQTGISRDAIWASSFSQSVQPKTPTLPYSIAAAALLHHHYCHHYCNVQEVLQRALHALEMAWHPQFDVRTANCRLDFEVPQNRPLFLALFKHVQVSVCAFGGTRACVHGRMDAWMD